MKPAQPAHSLVCGPCARSASSILNIQCCLSESLQIESTPATSAMESFLELDETSVRRIRKTSEDPPRVSVLDVISNITGLTTNNCSNVWDRLRASFPEVATGCSNFTFKGRGQKKTVVAGARQICEIVMVMKGENAARYRKKACDVLVRYLGGDPALVEELAANRLAQESLPSEHPMRIFGETVSFQESAAVKCKREAVELAELDLRLTELTGRAKKARVVSIAESVEIGMRSLQSLGLPIDDRARARATDMINQAIFEDVHNAPGDPEICVRQFIQQKGIRDASMDSRVGKVAKKLLLKDKPNHTFQKKSIYCNGQLLEANVWHESERRYLEQALASLVGEPQQSAQQSILALFRTV